MCWWLGALYHLRFSSVIWQAKERGKQDKNWLIAQGDGLNCSYSVQVI
jgi:hypothetical protein